MKQTKLIMGMPICIEIVDRKVLPEHLHEVFSFFRRVDEQFSPYKKTSEVSQVNRKEINSQDYSQEMREVLDLAQRTKEKTKGYFDVYAKGYFDPSGVVKSWAIQKAAKIVKKMGFTNFYINAGGDIQVSGHNKEGKKWTVGIRHPFEENQIVEAVTLDGQGIATSGTYLRGDHIFDPRQKNKQIQAIVSLTVIAPTVLEADLLATAAFAMERQGIYFLESCPGVEAYMIDKEGIATSTTGFSTYVKSH